MTPPPPPNSPDRLFINPENSPDSPLARLLKNYYSRHNAKSLASIINRWAPPTENNTASYIEAVSVKVGYPSHTDMDAQTFAEKLPRIVAAIARHENGYNVLSLAQAQRGVDLA